MGIGLVISIIVLALLALLIALNFGKVVDFFKRLRVFSGEVGQEMRKVTWPTMDEVLNSTILVVVATFALTIVLWIVDLVIGWGVRHIF